MTPTDQEMLRKMGIDPRPPKPQASDPHHECIIRWLEERAARERAEQSLVVNAQAYDRLSEAREREVETWKSRAWMFGALALGIALVSIVVLVAR